MWALPTYNPMEKGGYKALKRFWAKDFEGARFVSSSTTNITQVLAPFDCWEEEATCQLTGSWNPQTLILDFGRVVMNKLRLLRKIRSPSKTPLLVAL